MVCDIWRGARADASKGKAALGDLQRQLLNGLVDVGRVINSARTGQKFTSVGIARDFRDRAVDRNSSKGVKLALVDREVDQEAVAFRIKIGVASGDADIGVTVLEIILAQQFAIERHPIGVVDAGALDEVEPACLGGGDDIAQLAVVEGVVAHEVDAFDLRRAAFCDFEHEVDAILLELDDFGLDGRSEPALAAVDIKHTLNVGLNFGAGEDRARLKMDFARQRRGIDF